jgi:hypothetical protein
MAARPFRGRTPVHELFGGDDAADVSNRVKPATSVIQTDGLRPTISDCRLAALERDED